ncbi:hypothetical protein TVAG_205320 [Trichomonas vaginalis G3]|uniref:Uncharacterized protein n=1 Tax=Trichomonas vaginalis (strain ATCC PRA-98 / G3) TaxID=412133 RepID=A2FFR2_TRIV3|nr:coagulation factor 5/8 C-terminal domain-containing protein family [Trichomonas vaginalis G3]EAX96246.1 hypothetical protein TVAG_205320 [Trichomonas vaginalis G3]KAI5516246.1 coagulation factor 5/8 C-terminal domain-containing protein family [Trichomonas vaginalis G3]|eukprot:XP_001309176.1 hypothetical protein [Trichomonas vaginalis G3]
MEITASSVESGNLSIINSYSDKDFYTKNHPNSWLRADLNGYQLKPTSYFIRSCCNNIHYLFRNWKLEGIRVDGTSVMLDTRSYNIALNEIKEFPLQTNDYFVAFKITQIGKNANNDNCFDILMFLTSKEN